MNKAVKEFRVVSSIVKPEIITAVTKGCRGNCMVSVEMGETTCMGIKIYYDKHGHVCVDNVNRFVANVYCSTCDKAWLVNNKCEVLDKSE